jgi:ankyrin repeat protein
MFVREALGDIFKPKSPEEIENEITSLNDKELVELVVSKGVVGILHYALDRELSPELNGKLLEWAVDWDRGDPKIVEQILKRDLLPRHISLAISKTLHPKNIKRNEEAKYKNNNKIFYLLLKDPRLDPGSNRNQLIRWAASNGHTQLVRELLKDPRVDPSDVNNAALTGAEVYEHDNIIRLLLNDERVINKFTPEMKRKYNISEQEHQGIGGILKPKSRDEIFDAALKIKNPDELLKTTIEKIGDPELVKVAIERGADPNKVASDSGLKNPEIIKILLTNPQTKVSPNSLVYKALKVGLEKEIIKLIKDNKLDPGQKNSIVFVWAVEFGRDKLVDVLLKDKRVQPEKEEESVAEALSIAIARGNNKLVNTLLQDKRINPGADYNRAIKVASQFGNKEAVELLLKDKRVDPSQEDFALQQAYENGHNEIVALLLKDKRVSSKLSETELKKYKEMAKKLVRESLVEPEVEDEVKLANPQPSKPAPTKEPTIHPGKPGTKPSHPSPIRRERPSVTPGPKATADEVAKKYMKLVGEKK